MVGFVDGYDWVNSSAMLYWSYPSSYTRDKKTEIRNYIFSGDYYGSLKVDGYYQRLVRDDEGNCFMIARNKDVNGNPINKLDWVPQLKPFMDSLPNGTVLFCECFLPNNEGSRKITSLLGCLKDKCIQRQEAGQKLHFYIFDVAAYNGRNYITTPFEQRIRLLKNIKEENFSPYVTWATYYSGERLWEVLQTILAAGREGMVITRYDCPIYFKRTPARMTIKIKKELAETIDCFFTGHYTIPTRKYEGKEIETWKYWVNLVTNEKIEGEKFQDYFKGAPIEPVTKPFFYGWAGSLEIGVLKDGKITPIGFLSGLSEEIKSKPEKYKGKVIEVSCMEIQETGGLRHAKMIGFRPDLTIKDCQWEKIFTKE